MLICGHTHRPKFPKNTIFRILTPDAVSIQEVFRVSRLQMIPFKWLTGELRWVKTDLCVLTEP